MCVNMMFTLKGQRLEVESSTYCRKGFFCLLEMKQEGISLSTEEKVSVRI